MSLVFCANIQSNRNEDFINFINHVRNQLAEQLKYLELRSEAQSGILSELNEFYKRRAELDAEYSRQLDKLARNTMQKHKAEKNRRENWPLLSTCEFWQHLVDGVKSEARQRSSLSDIYVTLLSPLIVQRSDDLNRLSKKCREIGALAHGGICQILNELHSAMESYQLAFSEYAAVEAKLRVAEENKQKYEELKSAKLEKETTRKYRRLKEGYEKRLKKFEAYKLQCNKARNEYLLCIEAANACLHKYFADDMNDLIDCMDLGAENWLKRLISNTIGLRKAVCHSEMDSLGKLSELKSSLDFKADKQRFFEVFNSVFMLPKPFEFKGQLGDQVSSIATEGGIADELMQRNLQIERRFMNLRLESEEIWKILESTERTINEKFFEIMSNSNSQIYAKRDESSPNVDLIKHKQEINSLYDCYLLKFSHYFLNSNLIERLEIRSKTISDALNNFMSFANVNNGSLNSLSSCPGGSKESNETNKSNHSCMKRRIGVGNYDNENVRRPRLFGGSLDEYIECTGEAIPVIIVSTIRILSQFAMHHQGVFRISGSQIEINLFKEAYERGEDPLFEVYDASDINSVAGVLKLYFRELREPLFPTYLFEQFTDCAKCANSEDFIKQVVPLLDKLSLSTRLVLRYLFAFLNHLTEFNDENMMDPYNLSVCFGPTLLPIPDGKDQVFYHTFVHELVKNLIIYHNQAFSPSLPGPKYDKYALDIARPLYIDEQDSALSGEDDALTSSLFSGKFTSTNHVSATSISTIQEQSSSIADSESRFKSVERNSDITEIYPNASVNFFINQNQSPCPTDGGSLSNQFEGDSFEKPRTVSEIIEQFRNQKDPITNLEPINVPGCVPLFRQQRYKSEEQTTSDMEANKTDGEKYCSSTVQPLPRKPIGPSSLREQLHHSRLYLRTDHALSRDYATYMPERTRNHRFSLHAIVSPTSSGSYDLNENQFMSVHRKTDNALDDSQSIIVQDTK